MYLSWRYEYELPRLFLIDGAEYEYNDMATSVTYGYYKDVKYKLRRFKYQSGPYHAYYIHIIEPRNVMKVEVPGVPILEDDIIQSD